MRIQGEVLGILLWEFPRVTGAACRCVPRRWKAFFISGVCPVNVFQN
jgi:hypothetical protein